MGALDIARRLGSNAGRLGRLFADRVVIGRRAPFWLMLRLAPPLEETRAFSWSFGRERHLALLEALRVLEAAAVDDRVAGVLLRLSGAPHGLAAAMSLRRAVDRLRAAGKRVAAYGDRVGLAEYWVGCGAEALWLPETGSVHLVGLRSEGLFLSRLLERLHVRPEVVRVGSHKTAAETFTRESMSPEAREQVEGYFDECFGQLVDAVAAGRGLEPDAVRARIDGGPYGAAAAVEAGLADGGLYPDQVEARRAEWVPDSCDPDEEAGRPRLLDATVYDGVHASDPGWRPLGRDLPHIAYVAATGAIRKGPGLSGISADALRVQLERLRRDDSVRGVVLRIASPGGDALASDLLWRGVRRVQEHKPVVVSMGEVAASGGYFAAVGAGTVLAEAATLTGSIGVVGGKLNLEGLYERLGIGRDAVERGQRAGMLSETRGFTPDERAAVRAEMEAIYDVFLRRVAEGRELSRSEVERVAQGRIWSGVRARALRLVDALGGPLEALHEVRARAGIAESERFVLDVYPKLAPLEGLRSLIGIGLRLR